MRRRAAGLAAGLTAVAIVLATVAACAVSEQPSPTPTEPTSAPTEPTPVSSPTASTLPGEPFDGGPREGDVIAVVGVAHDDVLDLRAVPGVDGAVLAPLGPLTEDLVAAGQGRQVEDSIWYMVAVDGQTGWVDGAGVQYLGGVDDVTSRVIETLGSRPSAGTMRELGLVVARALASTDPASRITMTVADSLGDLGEVTYDVVGLGDDSVGGLRLHVFGAPDGDGFVLKSVEQTTLCLRGVSDGLCV